MGFWASIKHLWSWGVVAGRAASLARSLEWIDAQPADIAAARMLEARASGMSGDFASARESTALAIVLYEQSGPWNPMLPTACFQLAELIEIDPNYGSESGMGPETLTAMKRHEAGRWRKIALDKARATFAPGLSDALQWHVAKSADVAEKMLEGLS